MLDTVPPADVDADVNSCDITDPEDIAPDDVEMSLFDHLEELRQRIFYSLLAVLGE